MKILAYCPAPLDGTAYWRVSSPLGLLRKRASDVQTTIVGKIDHNMLLDHDVLLLQRPFLDEHVSAAQVAHVLGRPVWCDWDDDILGVPANNLRTMIYNKPRYKSNVRLLASAADAVTVTNKELAKKMREAGALRPMVIPNALDPTLELPPVLTDKLPVRSIAWRGGDSHNEDLMVYGDGFAHVAQEFEGEVLWHFIGFNPYWLLPKFPSESVHVHSWLDNTIAYFRYVAQLRPSFLAVPLVDTRFNRCKSNISVIEASWLGAVPIVPEWLEGCAVDGALTYTDRQSFEEALRLAVAMPESERADRVTLIRLAVARDYSLEDANLLRALTLKKLVERELKQSNTSTQMETK